MSRKLGKSQPYRETGKTVSRLKDHVRRTRVNETEVPRHGTQKFSPSSHEFQAAFPSRDGAARGSTDTRNYASEKSNIRCVVVTPDAKNPKPRPPLKPDFDRPVRLIVNL
jgi:hypothetical protein